MADLNQLAAQVTHSVDLQRLANSISKGESKEFDKLADFIRTTLLKYDTINTKKLLNELVKLITAEVVATNETVLASISKQVTEAISEEVSFQYAVIKAISSKRPVRPPMKSVNTAILNTPMVLNDKAYTWEERLSSFNTNSVSAIKKRIQAGWANGETTQEISRAIVGNRNTKGIIKQAKSSTNSLVKDLLSHSSSMVKAQVAKENDDIIIGEKTITTLDSRTSPICQVYSRNGGKEWLYAKVGRNFPRPGFHFRCRSTNIFIVAPEYDLELDAESRPAVVDGEAIQVEPKTSWFELAKTNPAVAENALGPARAKLIKNMSADEYYKIAFNSLNEQRTLDQMIASSKKVADLLKD